MGAPDSWEWDHVPSRWSSARSQLRSLGPLLRETKGPGDAALMLATLAWSKLAPQRLTSQLSIDPLIEFKRFALRFRAGNHELTPYSQIVEDLPTLGSPQARAEWTVLDGGANIGLFSLLIQPVARVIAIEPNPSAFARLEENLRRNALGGRAINAALSERTGVAFLKIPEGASTLSRLADDGVLQVRAVSIDDLLDELQIERVDLAKLDVEGHELEALAGARRSLSSGRIKRIYIEFVGTECLEAIDAAMAAHGYHRYATTRFNALFARPETEGTTRAR